MEKRKKKEKGDGLFVNYCYLYKGWFQMSRWNILFMVMILAGGVSSLYMGLYLPKIAVSLVMSQVPLHEMAITFGLAGLLYFFLSWTENAGYRLMNSPSLKYRHVLEERILHKICRTAYCDLEDPDYKKRIEHAKHLYQHWDRDARQCIWDSVEFVYLLITIPITSGMLMSLHPTVIVVLAVGTWLQYRLSQRNIVWEKKYRDLWQPLEMRIDYISWKVADFSYAKDIRLYAADKWLLPKYKKLMGERRNWKKKQIMHGMGLSAAGKITEVVKQMFVYGFLLWGVISGNVRADDFVLYVGLALSLSDSFTQVAMRLSRVRESMLSISDYRKMMSMPDSRQREEKGDPGLPEGRAPGITFSHVSFAYPGTGENTLEDVDITIRPGEKIALVGANGAGKSTLVKLLCGMYEPTGGEILLDGVPAARWGLEEWYRLFSVVFQDVGVIPATIAENVSSSSLEKLDRNKVRACLEQAGLLDLAESLPEGLDTCLPKEMFREGVNLSGGETQKLLLARAIYKEAPILVLDEPTAALDSKAENQLYLKYNELTRGRTSVFISHRLSSTRFCDRILMMENGRIVEEGSHEELMEKKGIYYRLFQVQSHYYRNDRTEEFSSGLDPEWEVSGYVSR